MLVELGLVHALGDAVEVGEQVGRDLPGFVLALLRLAQQIVDQHLGVHLFLDVERRGVDDEVAPVLLILAAPDELRIEVAVAALVGHADRVSAPSSAGRTGTPRWGCSSAWPPSCVRVSDGLAAWLVSWPSLFSLIHRLA